MECKKFNYKNYKNCWFNVGTYVGMFGPMFIEIENASSGPICVVTVNMPGYCYDTGETTIRNYSESSGITKFLQKMGIIKEVYSRKKCNPEAGKNETIDYCEINIEKLKEYSKNFDYEY